MTTTATKTTLAALPPVRVEADVGLLPCPFCGGRAEMNYGGFGECFVTCADDNCGGRLGTGIWFTAAAQAMDVWNRRPNIAVSGGLPATGKTYTGRAGSQED